MKRTYWTRAGGISAVVVLLLIGLTLGCAESKLNRSIKAQTDQAAAADAAAAASLDKKAAIEKITADARASATGPDGTVDPAKEYAALKAAMSQGAVGGADAGALATAVASGKTPDQAAMDLATQAAVDAKKYSDAAAAARAAVVELQKQLDAAHEQDTKSWVSGLQQAGTLANMFWPGVGTIVGGLGAGLVLTLRHKKTLADAVTEAFGDGQADGATQVTQSVATLRKLSPSVDAALNAVGPLVKTIVAGTMDDRVAAAVDASKNTPAPDTHDLISSVPSAPVSGPMVAAATATP